MRKENWQREYDRWKTTEPEEQIKREPDPDQLEMMREFEQEQNDKYLNV